MSPGLERRALVPSSSSPLKKYHVNLQEDSFYRVIDNYFFGSFHRFVGWFLLSATSAGARAVLPLSLFFRAFSSLFVALITTKCITNNSLFLVHNFLIWRPGARARSRPRMWRSRTRPSRAWPRRTWSGSGPWIAWWPWPISWPWSYSFSRFANNRRAGVRSRAIALWPCQWSRSWPRTRPRSWPGAWPWSSSVRSRLWPWARMGPRPGPTHRPGAGPWSRSRPWSRTRGWAIFGRSSTWCRPWPRYWSRSKRGPFLDRLRVRIYDRLSLFHFIITPRLITVIKFLESEKPLLSDHLSNLFRLLLLAHLLNLSRTIQIAQIWSQWIWKVVWLSMLEKP